MEEVYYLYKITNNVNQKSYIGMTKDPELRMRQHFTKRTTKSLIRKAITKYGKDSFIFEVLCIGSKSYIGELEQKAIEAYKTNCTTGHGYNVAEGGFGGSLPRRGKVESRKDDKCFYVSGFWFPSKRLAIQKLKWTTSKFRYRRDNGTLGDVFQENIKDYVQSNRDIHYYYRGFWFPNLHIASQMFNMNLDTIKKEIRAGRFEQDESVQDFRVIRAYFIMGKPYKTLKVASEDLNLSEACLKGRYNRKQDLENYSYTYIKEVLK